jgi:hypothetical protein
VKTTTIWIIFLTLCGQGYALPETQAVSWSIGKDSSKVDGAVHGPVTFTWTFNKPVQHGTYADGTPFVVWTEGLELISASPEKKIEHLLNLGATNFNAVVDATCINPREGELPLDERMGYQSGVPDGQAVPWGGGAGVWDETSTAIQPGDCIVTGLGRRVDRGVYRRMLYTAFGVCNVVRNDMTGRYRPPIRMPREQRAALQTPLEVDAAKLPSFNVPSPKNWSGSPVTLNLSAAVSASDADDLLNGPMGNCGIYTHVWYETANGMLNHELSGTDDNGYQRNVSARIAKCLYTAFDSNVELMKRQRSLNKFIQAGLDYYYMHALGYAIGNGGGGHCNGVEAVIVLAGALTGESQMTDDIKYQRFSGAAVGNPGVIHDMLSGPPGAGDLSRSEALHTFSPAGWKSGGFSVRPIGSGAASLEECIPRIDMADPGMVLNCDGVPYDSIVAVDVHRSAITISSSHQWKMYSENVATERSRSWRFIIGGVMRLSGDGILRKIVDFRQTVDTEWEDSTWPVAQGKGGVLMVHPPLTAQELDARGASGTLTTGVCSRDEAENDGVVLWESWPVSTVAAARKHWFFSPIQDYLDIKVGDFFYWLPFYYIVDDPGAPGKKLYEESMTCNRLRRFIELQRDAGGELWNRFTGAKAYNIPKSQVVQALTRYYLLDDTLSTAFCKTYDPLDRMWTDPVPPPPPPPTLSHGGDGSWGHGSDVIRWTTEPGQGYRYSVWVSTNLNNGFQPLEMDLPDTVQSFTNLIHAPAVFYKVGVR